MVLFVAKELRFARHFVMVVEAHHGTEGPKGLRRVHTVPAGGNPSR